MKDVIFAQVDVSYRGICVRTDGSVWAWGGNYRGELGVPATPDGVKTPVKVLDLGGSDIVLDPPELVQGGYEFPDNISPIDDSFIGEGLNNDYQTEGATVTENYGDDFSTGGNGDTTGGGATPTPPPTTTTTPTPPPTTPPTTTPTTPATTTTPTTTPSPAPSDSPPTDSPTEDERHTVTFDLAGGTYLGGGPLRQSVLTGGSAEEPRTGRAGFIFIGWDRSFSNVTSDLTVAAKWEHMQYRIPVPNEPIISISDMALYHATSHMMNAVLSSMGGGFANSAEVLESVQGKTYSATDLAVSGVGSVPILLVSPSLKAHCPNKTIPLDEFSALYREVTGADYLTYRAFLEAENLMSFDDENAYWTYDDLPFESWDTVETRSGKEITIEVTIGLSGLTEDATVPGSGVWQIKGELTAANTYAPYELVSVTYLGVED